MLYIYNRNLQFLNTVINIKTKVLLPKTKVLLPKTKVLLPHATSTDFSCIAPRDFYTWLIKAMPEFFYILFPQYNILFPQERYFVPTTYYLDPTTLLSCSLNILLLILINYLPQQRPPIL